MKPQYQIEIVTKTDATGHRRSRRLATAFISRSVAERKVKEIEGWPLEKGTRRYVQIVPAI
ncbi:MAG: hypothetical protein ISN29_00020 [Gammaproteobacteria bacterium AqS3]|nr:hypothetical protein [Gammaproteobacteria bacterium AqS3]